VSGRGARPRLPIPRTRSGTTPRQPLSSKPILTDPAVAFIKGFCHRPFDHQAHTVPDGGGWVTELVARPLLNMYWPELAGFMQPLAGEYAGRRAVLEQVPFVTGYGVELGLLVDLLDLVGLDAMAQVDLGCRRHTHQNNEALGGMAGQIMLTAFERLQRQGRIVMSEQPATVLAQFRRGDSGYGVHRGLVVSDVAVPERPPLAGWRVDPHHVSAEHAEYSHDLKDTLGAVQCGFAAAMGDPAV
jgi:glucosyl-3-phosphoglycerate synthase